MSNFGSRKPLHMQEGGMAKAIPENDSYESFRPNVVHQSKYREMDGSANEGMSTAYRVRRYPNGDLDFDWMANQIIDAIHNTESHGFVSPIEQALLTICLPMTFRFMEPQQAEIMTQLSDSEKDILIALVERHMAEEANWAAGRGGGNVRPKHKGIP